MSSRGRGGKFNKAKRGGGKHFSRDLQPLDKEGNVLGMWRDPNDKISEASTSEDESSSATDSGEEGPSQGSGGQELTREQRKEVARLKKQAAIARKNKKAAEVGDMPTDSSEEEEDDMPANPNHSAKARAQARGADGANGEVKKAGDTSNLSRREREAIEKEKARQAYERKRAAGETEEARADLERLRLVRKQREEAAARKKAEQEEREEREKANEEERRKREEKLRAAAMGGAAAGPKAKGKGKK